MKNIKRKIWLIGDTHFNHKELRKDLNEPLDVDELIWSNLEKVGDNDILIHLGDICVGDDYLVHEKISKFKFIKILVKGNHDNKSNNWYLNNGWNFVCKSFKDRYFGQKIVFSHKPVVWDRSYDLNIHGHFHNFPEKYHEKELVAIKNDFQRLFILEDLDYGPILLEEFIEKFN